MAFKSAARNLLRGLGWDVLPFTVEEHPLARRRRLLETLRIDLVLDVGANSGQYGAGLRALGYRGRIVSFEPLSAPFAALQAAAARDADWEANRLALGDREGPATIHVAGNSYSSSLLEMLPAHLSAAPGSATVGAEEIEVRRLDALFPGLRRGAGQVWLKIDTQGFEGAVLDGARESLAAIDTVQLELSLSPLYRGQLLFDELHQRMRGRGFALVGLEPGFSDAATGRLLQLDGIYHRDRG